jgi:hypothetical protein
MWSLSICCSRSFLVIPHRGVTEIEEVTPLRGTVPDQVTGIFRAITSCKGIRCFNPALRIVIPIECLELPVFMELRHPP